MDNIIEFGLLNQKQKVSAVELFMAGFGRFMTFSKDEELKRRLFLEIFDSKLFLCYIAEDKVLGLMGLATCKKRPINFKPEVCKKYFGKIRGAIISSQMNAIFQSPVVKGDNELYLDVLVTDSNSRRSGVGTELLKYAFNLIGYDVMYTEVFSKNVGAIEFYQRNGFKLEKEERFSILRLQGEGYPLRMQTGIEKKNGLK